MAICCFLFSNPFLSNMHEIKPAPGSPAPSFSSHPWMSSLLTKLGSPRVTNNNTILFKWFSPRPGSGSPEQSSYSLVEKEGGGALSTESFPRLQVSLPLQRSPPLYIPSADLPRRGLAHKTAQPQAPPALCILPASLRAACFLLRAPASPPASKALQGPECTHSHSLPGP